MITRFSIDLVNGEDNIFCLKKEFNKSNNNYIYSDEDIVVKLRFSENFSFIKETNDNILEISVNNGIINAKLFLKEINDYVIIPIELINYDYNKKRINVVYKLDDEEKTLIIKKE